MATTISIKSLTKAINTIKNEEQFTDALEQFTGKHMLMILRDDTLFKLFTSKTKCSVTKRKLYVQRVLAEPVATE